MKDNNSSRSSAVGITFAGALTIVFIVLKLLGKISWSWMWVLSPLWISALLTIAVIVFIMFAFGLTKKQRWRKYRKSQERIEKLLLESYDGLRH